MCGIVGYIGTREAFPILISGLKRLEYRGYDSAGIALINEADEMMVYKEKGKVSNLEERTLHHDTSGTIGIAHTRWATHGEPSSVNAHPHLSESGRLALVHNGIIENYANIKEYLTGKGYHFKSSTDTEVLVQLIEFVQQRFHLDLGLAVLYALRRVVGAYAIAVLDREHPDEIICARKSSPLVVGIGENKSEFFLASDALPIVGYTKHILYLNDEEVAVIRRGEDITVKNLANSQDLVSPNIHDVDIDLDKLEKGGFPHYMLKEIFEQPRSISDCMRGRLLTSEHQIVLSAIKLHRDQLVNAGRFIIVACGTSWHAGLIGKQMIE